MDSGSTKREWCCKRCKEPINIFVPDSERKFVIDGENLFCGKTCKSAYKQHIPIDPARKKLNQLKKHGPKKLKEKSKPLYKCFKCEHTTHFMTWNKLCSRCEDKMYDEVGSISNVEKSQIRLYQITQ